MQCNDIRELIDRFGLLEEDQRADVYTHVAGCSACRRYLETESSLGKALDALAEIDLTLGKARLQTRLKERSRQLLGQAVRAVAAVAVAAGAAIYFILAGDPFGKFALTGTALVLIAVAWRSRSEAGKLAAAGGDAAGLGAWREQLVKERRQIIAGGPLGSGLFAVMALISMVRFGPADIRSVVFALTCLGILAYTLRQLLVRRPVVERELALLEEIAP